ncbi:MAG TPA: hypothetical protein VJ782_09865 [Aeromicrobium sp.]|nr:hypothetical protein [Aeromicrobium sp.]
MALSGEPEFRTITQLRRDAFEQDLLLFCLAFSGGAFLYAVVRALTGGATGGDFWEIGLSDGLFLSGLVAGEAFLFWNLGIRQGLRGHSIGKHRVGLVVADVATRQPVGLVRGAVRGAFLVVLVDLAAAAVPVGLPTVLRALTPDQAGHIGLVTYIAAALLLVAAILPIRRDLADRLLRTEIVRASGAGAVTSPRRRKALIALDVAGVLGVAAVMAIYVAYWWPVLWQFAGWS